VTNPKPNPLHTTTPVAWVEEEVNAWIRSRIKGVPYQPPPLPERPVLIRKAEVLRRTGLSHPWIWKLEKQGNFPTRVRLGVRPTVAEAVDAAD
jgi:predicted DNA-binding transcriptional regulator AlpA